MVKSGEQGGKIVTSIEEAQRWFKMQAYLRKIDISYLRSWNRPLVLFYNSWRRVYDVMLYFWGLYNVTHEGRPVP